MFLFIAYLPGYPWVLTGDTRVLPLMGMGIPGYRPNIYPGTRRPTLVGRCTTTAAEFGLETFIDHDAGRMIAFGAFRELSNISICNCLLPCKIMISDPRFRQGLAIHKAGCSAKSGYSIGVWGLITHHGDSG